MLKNSVMNIKGGEHLLVLAGWKTRVRAAGAAEHGPVGFEPNTGGVHWRQALMHRGHHMQSITHHAAHAGASALLPPVHAQVENLEKFFYFDGEPGSHKWQIMSEGLGLLQRALATIHEKAEVRGLHQLYTMQPPVGWPSRVSRRFLAL